MTIPLKFRAFALTAAVVTAAWSATACGSSESTNSAGTDSTASSEASDAQATSQEGQWPRTVTTLNGAGEESEVTLEKAPTNIASTSVTLTGNLLALDAPVTSTGVQSKGNAIADDKGFFKQWAPEAEDAGLEVSYEGQPDVEAILAQNPDLVVMSSSGQDSATSVYDQLADVVPVIVVDYSNKQWSEVLEELGTAIGHEKQADEAIASYHDRISAVTKSITAPAQPLNIVSLGQGGNTLNVWTKESAQGSLFHDLGWEIAVPDAQYGGGNPQFDGRSDVVSVAAENFGPALTGKTIFALNADGKDSPTEFLKTQEQLKDNPAISTDSVHDLQPYAFRIDYYSAMKVLDDMEALFKN
nr:Fe2+-enterobactin ABC transporter substrate-binding protein [Corynebacterium sp. UBA5992]